MHIEYVEHNIEICYYCLALFVLKLRHIFLFFQKINFFQPIFCCLCSRVHHTYIEIYCSHSIKNTADQFCTIKPLFFRIYFCRFLICMQNKTGWPQIISPPQKISKSIHHRICNLLQESPRYLRSSAKLMKFVVLKSRDLGFNFNSIKSCPLRFVVKYYTSFGNMSAFSLSFPVVSRNSIVVVIGAVYFTVYPLCKRICTLNAPHPPLDQTL